MLKALSVQEFLDVLASGAPAPGGGSAAALSGAQGAALGAMVTELTVGKKKYAEHEQAVAAAGKALHACAQALLEDVDLDTQAFDRVSDAMRLPKETDEEKTARKAAMQQALLGATQSPLQVLDHVAQALAQLRSLLGKFNTNTASDLGTGAALLRAAAQGAWLNVLINVGSLADKEEANRLHRQAEALYRDALRAADDIFAQIETLCLP